jgi:hypothetical protein
MIRTILKAVLIAIITAGIVWVVGWALVLTGFPIAVPAGELAQRFCVGVGIIVGLWWGVNGGWSWSR